MNGYQAALRALRFEEMERAPVVLWAIGQNFAPFAGIPDNEYYADPDRMLNAQLEFLEYVGDVLGVPGLWPDFGGVPELGAMGAEIEFPTNSPPHVRRAPFQDIAEAEGWIPPDPRKADLTSRILDYLAYFRRHAPVRLQKEYGYLDGHLVAMGPGELTALTLGYDRYSYAIYDRPELVHQLCRKVTDFVKEYLRAQMEVVGPARRVILIDHLAGMVSANVYREYIHPYLNEVFDMVKDAEIRLFHNENNYPHLLDGVKDLGANVCHVGPRHRMREDKERLGKCLMGNVHPITELLQGGDEDVRRKCQEIIRGAGKGGGLWLSTAGGMAPETPRERIKLLMEVASETPID